MKISYRWLSDFVDLEILGDDIQVIARALTMIGFNVEEILALGENYIFDVEVTTNRPDCLNHLGIARELAAQFRLQLKFPDFSIPENPKRQALLPAGVTIEDPELCPRYAARVITGLRIAESPGWLRARLESVGQRPINNIVDITNYVMLEVGHPLHAFDYEKLAEKRIVVRTAAEGEILLTLDGVQRELDPSMLMICDARKPVALAGIMGGGESEISDASTTVLLESAYFHPPSIRGTAKKLGLRTEASFRFERGADPEMPVKALNRACRLIQEIAGGSFAGGVIDQYPNTLGRTTLALRSSRIHKVAGLDPDPEFVGDVLARLGFQLSPSGEKKWQVEVPSFRVDVGIEDDLVEEVARHHGYDRIEGTYPAASTIGNFLDTHEYDRLLIRTLEGLGFLEAFNYAFTNPSREALFWDFVPRLIKIENPLTEEDTHLRASLVPGLVEALRRNLDHGNREVRLFEFGKVFAGGSGAGNELQEAPHLGLLATGDFDRPYWDSRRHEFQFPHLKGILEVLLGKLGHAGLFEGASDISFFHPGMAARVLVQSQCWGVMGQLHPRIQEAYKFLQPVFLAELDLDPVYARLRLEPEYRPLGKFPAVERDLSFLVDNEVEYAKMVNALRQLNIPDLREVRLIDLYKGPRLPQGRVSLTVRLTFASPERTLTQEEINQYTDQIFSLLRSTFSVEARA